MSTIETRPDDLEAEALGETAPPERWEFRIGAPVYPRDGAPGTLCRVVVDPVEERVTGLIMRDDSIPPRDLLIPLDVVCRADDYEIQLSWTIHEARVLGRIDDSDFHTPGRGLGGYAPGEAAVSLRGGPHGEARESGTAPRDLPPIRVGLRVEALDGPAGRVRELLVVSATGGITHFVMRDGLIRKHDRLVPVEWVRSVTEEVVAVDATLSDLARLPEYRTDEDLQADIVDQWWGDGVLSPMLALTYVDARVRDGIATLEGYAWSRMHKHRLEELALCVRGVLGVRNEVVSDDELPFRVMEALAQDPRTRAARVRVYAYLGNVRIEGEAPDPATREAISEVAAGVPRVKSVINSVHLPASGPAPSVEVVRPVQPRRGQTVMTRDGRFGAVAKVILSPRTRLVTGIVVEGELPAPDAEPDATTPPDEWPRRERSVVIPREWIEAVAEDEVLLEVGIPEASAAPEFRAEEYRVPDPNWEPPFPYENDKVLLEIPRPPRPMAEYRAEPSAPVLLKDEGGRASGKDEGGRMKDEVSVSGGLHPSSLILHPSEHPSSLILHPSAAWPVLARGDRVRCPLGPVGTVDHLLIDPETHLAAYLVVRGGEGLPKDTVIPVEWIQPVDEHGILLDATLDQLKRLPEYHPSEEDAGIAAAVEQAMAALPRRGADTAPITVRVERGVVFLDGLVESDAVRRAAISAARAVSGVWEVRDELVTEGMAQRHAAALAAGDPRRRGSFGSPGTAGG